MGMSVKCPKIEKFLIMIVLHIKRKEIFSQARIIIDLSVENQFKRKYCLLNPINRTYVRQNSRKFEFFKAWSYHISIKRKFYPDWEKCTTNGFKSNRKHIFAHKPIGADISKTINSKFFLKFIYFTSIETTFYLEKK